ncbi:hypothetical protein AVEN_177755-1 [Araneus ventricosus]|uniref:C-type lectin domain-containing protein n=1 Tax=Araneus ventricosus TaxID=182803 RepID=A0A4Y2NF92_ARAVE|nr:hypothetical protein AVEN_248186-1 [Araneus ventricosus]GBN37587.1 hypothetical protein AVEN_254712-1 [Araneus ventricosus]GBN37593.1 hypothetical protein AVEN_22258-1 [Araneus ventricosus]GBN37642.1 hypothetical protein AVEN_177755-1 [Araneus ventricosus]
MYYKINFLSPVPTCVPSDVGADDFCYRLVKGEEGFEAAKSNCASLKIDETVEPMSLWAPDSTDAAQAVLEKLQSDLDVWLDNPSNEGKYPAALVLRDFEVLWV